MSFEKTGYKGISQELKIENVLYNQILIDKKTMVIHMDCENGSAEATTPGMERLEKVNVAESNHLSLQARPWGFT